ncbi:MAG: protein translocase subunit SecD [Deltaproteobacteria bacterium]|nr:MAG: protein translocase subunit SecD [Deltaproteobacteria bacterium]
MRQSVLTRAIIFAIAIVAAIIYLVPTFVSPLPSWWSSFLPTDRIKLGLDLQGGSHLVLGVKVDKAIENTVERIRGDLINVLREKGVSGVSVERVEGTQIQVKVAATNAERVRGILKSDFGNLVEAKTPQTSGGISEFYLTLSKEELRSLRDYAVDQSLETIRNRIDQFGVSEPIIQREGQENILIQLPGIQDPERAKEIIGKTALLEFKLVDDTVNVEDAIKNGPPPGRQVLYGHAGKGEGLAAEKQAYVVESRPLMTGEYIQDARVRPAEQLHGASVELILNASGARLFEQITAANVKRRLAIVLDNRVYSAPVIQERIGGGRASITGSFDIKEARDLSIVLRAGALPAPVEILEERTVGPSLGSDSIRQGVISFVVGSSLVIVFMIVYYRGAGAIADVALLFHILFLLAILAALKAVLTMPGIAGIVLIAGMAVDANVLINERIREELRAGRTPRSAIEAGFQHAMPAIIDTNVTTFLSGLILFQFGTGPIKGFAVTLCVGILTTVVTAVYMTRIYYDYRAVTGKLKQISI